MDEGVQLMRKQSIQYTSAKCASVNQCLYLTTNLHDNGEITGSHDTGSFLKQWALGTSRGSVSLFYLFFLNLFLQWRRSIVIEIIFIIEFFQLVGY